MNVCRRISFRLYFCKWTPNFGLVSLLVIDILNKSLSSFVAYCPHADEEYLWHRTTKYVSSWGVKNIQNWRDCLQGSADLFVLFSATGTKGSQLTPKSLQFLKGKEHPFFLYLILDAHHHLAGDISMLGNSPSSHLSLAPESKWPNELHLTSPPCPRGKHFFSSGITSWLYGWYLAVYHSAYLCWRASASRRKPHGEGTGLASIQKGDSCTTTFLIMEIIWQNQPVVTRHVWSRDLLIWHCWIGCIMLRYLD